jgi:hypothetical protein
MHILTIVLVNKTEADIRRNAMELMSQHVSRFQDTESDCACLQAPANELAQAIVRLDLGSTSHDRRTIESLANDDPKLRVLVEEVMGNSQFLSWNGSFANFRALRHQFVIKLQPQPGCVFCHGTGVAAGPEFVPDSFDRFCLGGRWAEYFAEFGQPVDNPAAGVSASGGRWLSLLQKDIKRYCPGAVVTPDGRLSEMAGGYSEHRWEMEVFTLANRYAATCRAVVVDAHA